MIHVTVWNEFVHEREEERVRQVYPQGIHMALKELLECDDVTVRTATLQEPECGLTEEVLRDTDVLVWWAHVAHDRVPNEIALRVKDAVLRGMWPGVPLGGMMKHFRKGEVRLEGKRVCIAVGIQALEFLIAPDVDIDLEHVFAVLEFEGLHDGESVALGVGVVVGEDYLLSRYRVCEGIENRVVEIAAPVKKECVVVVLTPEYQIDLLSVGIGMLLHHHR